MKQLLIFLFTLFFIKISFSQEIKTNLTLTEKQNAQWIEKFEKLTTKHSKITEIKNKIKADSIFRISNVTIHHWGSMKVERVSFGSSTKIYESNCECKIVFILSIKSNSYRLDYSEYKHTDDILKIINKSNINKMSVYKNAMASAMLGSRGRCGGIILHSNNKKLEKKIKKML